MTIELKTVIALGGLLATLLVSAGCVDELELPEPPNMQSLGDVYDNPTAQLTSEIAAETIADYLIFRQELARVDDFEDITLQMAEFSDATEVGDDGTVEIDGIPIRTDAVITLSGGCAGWEDEDDEESGVGGFSFQMIVRQSSIVPIIWGGIDDCHILGRRAGRQVRLRFSADLNMHLPSLPEADADELILLVSFHIRDVEFDGESLPAWAGSFRLVGETMEVLLEAENRGSLVVFAGIDSGVIGIRAANGNWLCSTGERRCESAQSPSASFSY